MRTSAATINEILACRALKEQNSHPTELSPRPDTDQLSTLPMSDLKTKISPARTSNLHLQQTHATVHSAHQLYLEKGVNKLEKKRILHRPVGKSRSTTLVSSVTDMKEAARPGAAVLSPVFRRDSSLAIQTMSKPQTSNFAVTRAKQ